MVSGLQCAARDARDKPTAPVLLGQADGWRPGACPSHVQDSLVQTTYTAGQGSLSWAHRGGAGDLGLGTSLLARCGREVGAVLFLARYFVRLFCF